MLTPVIFFLVTLLCISNLIILMNVSESLFLMIYYSEILYIPQEKG